MSTRCPEQNGQPELPHQRFAIVTGSKTDTDLQAKFVQAVRNGKKKKALADYVAALLNSDEAKAAAMTVLGKLIELGAKALAGGGGQ